MQKKVFVGRKYLLDESICGVYWTIKDFELDIVILETKCLICDNSGVIQHLKLPLISSKKCENSEKSVKKRKNK